MKSKRYEKCHLFSLAALTAFCVFMATSSDGMASKGPSLDQEFDVVILNGRVMDPETCAVPQNI